MEIQSTQKNSLKVPSSDDFKLKGNILPANDRFPPIKILLIDGDPNFRLIVSETLRAASFLVDVANNGTQALEKIKQQLPDMDKLKTVESPIRLRSRCFLVPTLQRGKPS